MSDTRQKIMSIARSTLQDRGYAGLSFRDLAKDVGIKSASIHYYFQSKGDLGAAVAEQTTAEFKAYLDGLLADLLDPSECIRRYTDVFRNMLLNENRMCLAGIMSAEHSQLPPEVRRAVVDYARMNIGWLIEVLSLRKKPQVDGKSIEEQALSIFAAIEGAQLVARSFKDVSIYDTLVHAYTLAGLLP